MNKSKTAPAKIMKELKQKLDASLEAGALELMQALVTMVLAEHNRSGELARSFKLVRTQAGVQVMNTSPHAGYFEKRTGAISRTLQARLPMVRKAVTERARRER